MGSDLGFKSLRLYYIRELKDLKDKYDLLNRIELAMKESGMSVNRQWTYKTNKHYLEVRQENLPNYNVKVTWLDDDKNFYSKGN